MTPALLTALISAGFTLLGNILHTWSSHSAPATPATPAAGTASTVPASAAAGGTPSTVPASAAATDQFAGLPWGMPGHPILNLFFGGQQPAASPSVTQPGSPAAGVSPPAATAPASSQPAAAAQPIAGLSAAQAQALAQLLAALATPAAA